VTDDGRQQARRNQKKLYISRPYYKAVICSQENLSNLSLRDLNITPSSSIKLTRLINLLKPEIYLQKV